MSAAKKILIVDDDPGYSEMMTSYFRSHNYHISSATSLEDAINVFRHERPRVVLLDFNMPLVNGDKFLPVIHAIDSKVRVIVITGFTEEEVEGKFEGLNYFAFFKKGDLSLEELKKKVDVALGL